MRMLGFTSGCSDVTDALPPPALSFICLPRLACLRVALLMATPFVPRGLLHTLEGVWCHLFTYLLLGTRFFNTFFVGESLLYCYLLGSFVRAAAQLRVKQKGRICAVFDPCTNN